MSKWERVSAVSSMISALASVIGLIGIIVAVYAYKLSVDAQSRQLKFDTIKIVAELGSRIDIAVSQKDLLDRTTGRADKFSYDYISSDPNVEKNVFTILNTYETLCTLTNMEVLPYEYWSKLRGDTFQSTMKQYGPYIARYQSLGDHKDAWKQCQVLNEKQKKHTQNEQTDKCHTLWGYRSIAAPNRC